MSQYVQQPIISNITHVLFRYNQEDTCLDFLELKEKMVQV